MSLISNSKSTHEPVITSYSIHYTKLYDARSKADAPEIDGVVYLDGFFDAQPGDFLKVRVIDADHHDLYAQPA